MKKLKFLEEKWEFQQELHFNFHSTTIIKHESDKFKHDLW